MKKSFLILTLLLLAAPFLTFADSYDGPYCFENPTDFQNKTYNDDKSHIRGTCKSVELTSVVSLDPSLQNDYLLAQHKPIDLLCERGCVTTKRSEIIQATTATLTFPNQDITREFQSYDYSSGESKSLGLIYDDTVAVLDKKYVLDYISAVYKQFGKKLDYNKLPQIVLMDQSEMKKVDKDSVGYSYDELFALFKGNDPLYVEKGLIGDTSSPSIYSFNYSDFGKHIASLKGSLSEYRYLDLDKTKLPSMDIKTVSSGRGRIVYVVPITSPVKSVKNYWIFTKKNGKIVLAWQKSEYILDNGTTKIDTNTNIKVDDSSSSINSTNIVTPSTPNVPSTLPAEQKKGFFSRLLDFILSWFK